jgi:hypothetical protein
MPRIPEAELERLKRDVSLVRLIESQGHELKRRGRDWVMRCVFHEEDTPSLSVSEAKNVYHCFGCNASGTVLDWVMKTRGVSLPHAVQLLRNDAPLAGVEKVGVNRSQARHLPSLAAGSDEAVLLREVADTYHATLKQSPEAQAYLTQRGLVHGELIDTFRLGYANKSLTYRLPPGYAKEGREVREKLQGMGVYRTSGHEHLNGCLVVPVFDLESGAVRQMYGRRIAPGHKIPAGQPKHLYLSLPLAGLWNEVALVASREVIVCEALIDALTFWCAGYRNVIAAYGVNGFTQDHWAALKRHGTQRVWIAYDRDDAGNAAAETLGAELRESGIETWRVLFPKGMDANDYARKVAPAEKSLGVLLQQSEWIGKGKRPAVAAQVEPWNTTALFRRVCRRTACAVKPGGGTKLLRDAVQIGMARAPHLANSRPEGRNPRRGKKLQAQICVGRNLFAGGCCVRGKSTSTTAGVSDASDRGMCPVMRYSTTVAIAMFNKVHLNRQARRPDLRDRSAKTGLRTSSMVQLQGKKSQSRAWDRRTSTWLRQTVTSLRWVVPRRQTTLESWGRSFESIKRLLINVACRHRSTSPKEPRNRQSTLRPKFLAKGT